MMRQTAVKGVYGADADAATYPGKFLHLSLTLPRARSWQFERCKHVMRDFVSHVSRGRCGVPLLQKAADVCGLATTRLSGQEAEFSILRGQRLCPICSD